MKVRTPVVAMASFRILLFQLVMIAAVRGAEPEPTSALRPLLDQSLNRFTILAHDGEAATKAKVVLRWDNKERGSIDGFTAIWFDQNQPVAVAAVYPYEGRLYHAFDLLSRDPGTVAMRNGVIVWRPARDQIVKYRPVPDAPSPAKSRTQRRLQLKALASRFSAELLGWRPDNADREKLRMLPTPIHRYEPSNAPDAKILDGAVFAFVKGTDPECVLVLEAYPQRGEHRWEYAFVRRTSGALEARYKGSTVWQVDKVIGQESNPTLGHFTLSAPLPPELLTPP